MSKSMKIGVVGTIWLNTPPLGYGGTEEVVANICNGMVDRGHTVSFFGPQTAKVKANVIPTVTLPLRDKNIEWTNVAYTLYHMTQAFDRSDEFDILHVHINKSQDYMALPLAMNSKTPILFTLHFMVPTVTYKRGRYEVLEKYGAFPFTSISDSQRNHLPVNFIQTVYNGLDIKQFTFSNKPKDYYVWLGKIKKEKGTHNAILAAKKAGVQLYILGVVEEGVPESLAYFQNEVKPLIDGHQIIFKEAVKQEEKVKILSGARALLNPIAWLEPFGLVMTEAMSCGTPVISFPNGAATELIIDGKTGFLVKTIDEMVSAMKKIPQIIRQDCRDHVENNFTLNQMIHGYETAYKKAIQDWPNTKSKAKKLLERFKDKPADFY